MYVILDNLSPKRISPLSKQMYRSLIWKSRDMAGDARVISQGLLYVAREEYIAHKTLSQTLQTS